MAITKRRYTGFCQGLILAVSLGLILAACGDNTNTSAPAAAGNTRTAAAVGTATTAATGAGVATTAAGATTSAATAAAGTTTTTAAATTPAAGAATTSSGPTDYSKVGKELVDAFAGKYKGTTVSFNTNCTTNKDCVNTFKDFQDKTGITVKLVPPSSGQEDIVVKLESNTIEDIVDFTNPGFLTTYSKTGKIVDLNKVINQDWLKANFSQGFLDTTTAEGSNGKILAGIFTYVNFKSAVWYPKKAFEAAGYKTPNTWAELKALSDQIVKDGDTPWCIGIESGGATGWPATDWIEDIMLRTTSPENYDKWVTGALPFTSPEVKNAFQMLTDIWFNDKYVFGGRKTIPATNFLNAPNPMFQDPTKCWLHKQANFITIQSFEKNKPGLKSGVDYDFFYFPPIDEKYGKPVLYAGDFFTMFNDRPEVRAVIQYTTTYDWIKPWIKAGGEPISPLKSSVLADYTTDVYRKMAQTILSATTVRFDGSDLMPAQVGAGSFWKGVTDYVSGSSNLDQALQTIQSGWANVKK